MSFKGTIEARCPNGCEPFSTEVWSFIRGEESPDLRMAVLARECNMILCPKCDSAFFPPAPFVYYEPRFEILAFVFPESYRAREKYWRGKMHEDFLQLRQALGSELSLDLEPEIFFGPEGLALLLEGEDYRGEEREVMECIALGLGLSLYRVSPRFARDNGVPSVLPYQAGKGRPDPESVIQGLERLMAANEHLPAYREYLRALKASSPGRLPPGSQVRS